MERFNDDEYNLKIEDIVISSAPEDTFFIRQCSVKNLKAFWLLRIPTVVCFAWIESLRLCAPDHYFFFIHPFYSPYIKAFFDHYAKFHNYKLMLPTATGHFQSPGYEYISLRQRSSGAKTRFTTAVTT